jgi:hypothetical protein
VSCIPETEIGTAQFARTMTRSSNKSCSILSLPTSRTRAACEKTRSTKALDIGIRATTRTAFAHVGKLPAEQWDFHQVQMRRADFFMSLSHALGLETGAPPLAASYACAAATKSSPVPGTCAATRTRGSSMTRSEYRRLESAGALKLSKRAWSSTSQPWMSVVASTRGQKLLQQPRHASLYTARCRL